MDRAVISHYILDVMHNTQRRLNTVTDFLLIVWGFSLKYRHYFQSSQIPKDPTKSRVHQCSTFY